MTCKQRLTRTRTVVAMQVGIDTSPALGEALHLQMQAMEFFRLSFWLHMRDYWGPCWHGTLQLSATRRFLELR